MLDYSSSPENFKVIMWDTNLVRTDMLHNPLYKG
jgi:hypothetical protein